MTHTRSAVLALTVAILASCVGSSQDGDDAPFGGTLVIASGAEPDALLPPLIMGTAGKALSDQLFEPLAVIGDDLQTMGDRGFTPRLAERWEWAADSLSIAFHIDPRARWHDGRPVVANDVKFTFDLVRTPEVHSILASNVENVDSVSVRDSSTAVVWFRARSPEQFYLFVYNIFPIPAHVYGSIKPEELAASPAARAPVGSGRFRFVRWVPQSTVELVADTANWRGRPKLDRILWSTRLDPTAATASVVTGESDFIEVLRGDAIKQVETSTTVRVLDRPSLDYSVMLFRLREGAKGERPHHVLGDRTVRRALTMAIDRPGVVRNILDTLGMPGIGPIIRSLSRGDTLVPQLAYDPAAARALLDSAGWRDTNGDGVRERNGRALEFSILGAASSTARARAATLIQDQLRQVGAKVNLALMENNAMGPMIRAGKFDAVLVGFSADPSPSGIAQNWSGEAARTGSGFNLSLYENDLVDATLDSASRAFDPDRAQALYRRASELVVADAPAVWLYELKGNAALHRRVRPAAMRADAWWAHLDEWTIDPAQAIDRDRIGLRERNPQ